MGLNVIFAASEASPFAKTGGLADVAGSLPVALKRLGCKVLLFLPYYREVAAKGIAIEETGLEVDVPLGRRSIKARVFLADNQGVPVYLIKRDEFFDRSYIYGTPEGDYFDNLDRYAFFSRAVLEVLKARSIRPDVIHSNDWQTGLIPAYLKDTYGSEPIFTKTATLLTVHNIAYQGVFDADLFETTGLSPAFFNPDGVEFWGKMNLLKAGLVYSDVITTVSRGYSLEIQTPEYGYGLEGVLANRKDVLYGVTNGVDYDEWDPGKDDLIPRNYSIDDLKGKAACKKKLLKEFGLKLPAGAPLIGMITRLADQKGLDILSEAMAELVKLDIGMVILGTGDKLYQELLPELAKRYPERLSVRIAFSNELSHLVEAGSDIFLMPSRYEPCGLNQIYSLRYGTVPVVRDTGGLSDTVRGMGEERPTGFKFTEYSAEALVDKVREAIAVYKDKSAWEELQRNGMREVFSWEDSARKYIELYRIAQQNCTKLDQPSLKNVQRPPAHGKFSPK